MTDSESRQQERDAIRHALEHWYVHPEKYDAGAYGRGQALSILDALDRDDNQFQPAAALTQAADLRLQQPRETALDVDRLAQAMQASNYATEVRDETGRIVPWLDLSDGLAPAAASAEPREETE